MTETSDTRPSRVSAWSPERTSILLCAVFCALVAGLAGLSIAYDHANTERQAIRHLAHTSDLIAQWILGAFHASDYLLRDMAGHIDPATLSHPHPDPEARRRLIDLLIEKKDTLPYAFLVGAFDRDCIATHTNAIVGFDASEREYCRVLREDTVSRSVVTQAYVSNLGRLNVTQARRLESEADEFLGMVAIGLDLQFFSRWLERIDVGRSGNVTILDTNGLLLARRPHLPESLGQQVTELRFLAAIADETTFRTLGGPSPIDGVERLFGIQQVPDLPFVVIVGDAYREIFEDWTWRTLGSLGAAGLLWLLALLFLRNHLLLLRQRAQLVLLAHHDPLTKIFNRRHFEELANLALKHAQRTGLPLSLLLLDMDRFKQINDRHGHATGDRALLAFVDACRSVLRDTELFARWGGDEFALLIEGDMAEAEVVGERLRAAWARIALRDARGKPLPLTASIGFATTQGGMTHSLGALFSQADDALYREKQARRERA